MAEHTPGPWVYRDPMRPWIDADNGIPICTLSTVIAGQPLRPEVVAANARLIAAAPALLAALAEYLDAADAWFSAHGDPAAAGAVVARVYAARAAARAAIARATGQPAD